MLPWLLRHGGIVVVVHASFLAAPPSLGIERPERVAVAVVQQVLPDHLMYEV